MTTKNSAPEFADGVEVTFARAWTVNGTDYKPDETGKVSPGDADELLRLGYARPADKK